MSVQITLTVRMPSLGIITPVPNVEMSQLFQVAEVLDYSIYTSALLIKNKESETFL